MKSEQYNAEYGCFSFNYTVVRRERKTLEIAVEPDSTVRVAAPKSASPERIAQKVKKRSSWILQQQRYFEQFAPRTPGRSYLSGETHLYLGRQYRLKVIKAVSDSVKLCAAILSFRLQGQKSPLKRRGWLSFGMPKRQERVFRKELKYVYNASLDQIR